MSSYRQFSVKGVSAKFSIDNEQEDFEIKYAKKYEKPAIEEFLQTAKEYESPHIFDIGANMGIYSILLDQSQPNSRIVAVEPYPPNTYKLLQNIIYNNSNIKILQVPISDKEELTQLSSSSDEFQTDGTVQIGDTGKVFVYTKTLNNIFRDDLNPPDIIKIDVEGAEGKVFRGLKDFISDIDIIFYELHISKFGNAISDFNDDASSIHELIDKEGFTREVVMDRGEEQIWKASQI